MTRPGLARGVVVRALTIRGAAPVSAAPGASGLAPWPGRARRPPPLPGGTTTFATAGDSMPSTYSLTDGISVWARADLEPVPLEAARTVCGGASQDDEGVGGVHRSPESTSSENFGAW